MKPRRLEIIYNLELVLLLFLAAFTMISSASASPLTPREERGRQVYVDGTSPSGVPIVAYFGKDLLEVPGESATCVSCHGHDGLGRTESGVIPSNITWPQIMKSYGHIHPDGVEHGAFTVESLKSYMEDGVYPGGKQGDPSMPVYQMAPGDLDDLLTYLRRLDTYLDPGLTDTTIRIGTLQPADGASADSGEIMRRTVQAYFNDVNASGGIYGRSLTLSSDRLKTAADMSRFLRNATPEQGVFALVNTFTPGMENELGNLVEEQRVPLIAPFSLFPVEDQLLHRYRFNLYSGLREQISALARHAVASLSLQNPRIKIIYPEREGFSGILDQVEQIYRTRGWQNIVRSSYPAGSGIPAASLNAIGKGESDLLLFLGGESDSEHLLKLLGESGCQTRLFMPGVLTGKSVYRVPEACREKVWLSFPSLPDDRKEWGLNEFQAMADRQKLALTHPTAQLSAYVSAKILVEGLRRGGRNLSRERLLESLEGLVDFDSGLARPVSYNKNRRTGTLGAYVVEIDPKRSGSKEYFIQRGWVAAQ